MSSTWMKKSRKSRRHRHRSYGRKVAESVGLVFGTPFLLFAILAFSVQAVEYESIPSYETERFSDVDSHLGVQDVASIPSHAVTAGH
ncbi:MAG: hypothetical protein VX252_14640 [Myxococcota bacterium]|nr:hypothetical protein [Myxococcota bacterium]